MRGELQVESGRPAQGPPTTCGRCGGHGDRPRVTRSRNHLAQAHWHSHTGAPPPGYPRPSGGRGAGRGSRSSSSPCHHLGLYLDDCLDRAGIGVHGMRRSARAESMPRFKPSGAALVYHWTTPRSSLVLPPPDPAASCRRAVRAHHIHGACSKQTRFNNSLHSPARITPVPTPAHRGRVGSASVGIAREILGAPERLDQVSLALIHQHRIHGHLPACVRH